MISTKSFSVNGKAKRMVTEASNCGYGPSGPDMFRIYGDACDVGIRVVSHKTRCETMWYLETEVRNEFENETILWRFRPTIETVRAYPNLAGWVLEIYND